MRWPHILNADARCPACNAERSVDAIHFLFESRGAWQPVLQAITWAICTACGHEWRLAICVEHRARPVA